MRLSVRTGRKYSYIVYPSEVVVYDDCGNTVVKYPTEEEAKEYIRNQERASSVKGHSGRKHPDISHADGGADAGEDKAPTTAKRFAIVLISTHLISPLNNNMI